jgi:hypothetical protein
MNISTPGLRKLKIYLIEARKDLFNDVIELS